MNALVVTWLLVCASSAGFFDGPGVRTVRIEIAAEGVEQLRAEPRGAVPAEMKIGSGESEQITVRLKGRGSFQAIDAKPSFTITRATAPSSPTKFHLNNSVDDSSYLKEKIGGEIFRRAGIPAPNVAHARVMLNGKDLGVYVLKEGFTREFIERGFGDSGGRLYDTDAGSDVDQAMELDLGESGGSHSELGELEAAAKEMDLGKRFERMAGILDVEQFVKFLAVEMLIGHWDGYALSRNNFRIYFDARDERVRFLPAGLDQIFAKADLPWNPAMAGLVAKALMETPQGRERYAAEFRKQFEAFSAEEVAGRIRELVGELRPFLRRAEFRDIAAEGEELIRNVQGRKRSLAKQLSEPRIGFPEFKDGIAELTAWQAFDAPLGGALEEDKSALHIAAGPKTSASWRKTVLLAPGHYTLSADVRTSEVKPLQFGSQHGASLRVLGRDRRSAAVLGIAEETLKCELEVESEQEVTFVCELRASGGRASFLKPIIVTIRPKK
jgi:spore coat protein H